MYKPRYLSLAWAAALLLASCTADDPAGVLTAPQPLSFSVQLSGDTRAAASDVWDGTEQVAVSVGSTVGRYQVAVGGALSAATPADVIYRDNTDPLTVTAWYPYSSVKPVAVTVAADQSTDAAFEDSNLMEASATAVFGSTTTLTFAHRTARITVSLTDQSADPIASGADVTIAGITAHNDGAGQYSVLVAPTTIAAATQLVQVAYGGKDFAYELPAALTLVAGRKALYDIQLGPVGVTVHYFDLIADAVETYDDGYGNKRYTLTIPSYNPATDVAVVTQSTYPSAANDYSIVIGNGTQVTLQNVKMQSYYYEAGITCSGSAEIILDGTNTVNNTGYGATAILIGGSGTTLTVSGTGSLDVQCGYFGAAVGNGAGDIVINGGTLNVSGDGSVYAPGIGASQSQTCGSITINGGTVTATGGDEAPGIGTCNGTCGTITITGGTVTAEAHANNGAPGIGAANNGTCGDIIISGGSVTATGAAYGWQDYKGGAGIGTGWNSTCGDITISGGTVIASGRSYAAGIGTAGKMLESPENKTQCGAITISGTANVTASKEDADTKFCIGLSSVDDTKITCGTVTVEVGLTDSGEGATTRTIHP